MEPHPVVLSDSVWPSLVCILTLTPRHPPSEGTKHPGWAFSDLDTFPAHAPHGRSKSLPFLSPLQRGMQISLPPHTSGKIPSPLCRLMAEEFLPGIDSTETHRMPCSWSQGGSRASCPVLHPTRNIPYYINNGYHSMSIYCLPVPC
jgi:hypothetical protein